MKTDRMKILSFFACCVGFPAFFLLAGLSTGCDSATSMVEEEPSQPATIADPWSANADDATASAEDEEIDLAAFNASVEKAEQAMMAQYHTPQSPPLTDEAISVQVEVETSSRRDPLLEPVTTVTPPQPTAKGRPDETAPAIKNYPIAFSISVIRFVALRYEVTTKNAHMVRGMVVNGVKEAGGEWQVSQDGETWSRITSDVTGLYLPVRAKIRYVGQPGMMKEASIQFRPWMYDEPAPVHSEKSAGIAPMNYINANG